MSPLPSVYAARVIRWRRGTVRSVGPSWPGATELEVDVPGAVVRALAYIDVVGTPQVGDDVVLNTSAQSSGLGTGGYALVVALPDRLPPDPSGPGHLVKARYTPTQTMVLGVDEQESAHHALLAEADDLGGMPVVVADLHSALPAVLAGLRLERPGAGVAYVMTDGAALPLAFSRTVAGLRAAQWLATTVTVGQAYGGELEAVTLHSGLLAARLVGGADVAVVVQGPGNLGTGTPWGFSGVAAGEAVNAVGVLGGRAVGCLRVSEADSRERHRGVSHHSLTAYGRVALLPADIVIPALGPPLQDRLEAQTAPLAVLHRLVTVPVDGLLAGLQASPVALSTMGRGLAEDPACFLAAAAAGRYAAGLL